MGNIYKPPVPPPDFEGLSLSARPKAKVPLRILLKKAASEKTMMVMKELTLEK